MSAVADRVKEMIHELLGASMDRIILDTRFREDLCADSLDLVELIMMFEEEFGGYINDDDAQRITTVGDAITYIETYVSTKKDGS